MNAVATTAGTEVFSLLLVQAGGWLVGLDAGLVHNIRPVADELRDSSLDLGAFLGRRVEVTNEDKPRILSLAQGGVERHVMVDHTVGAQALPVDQLRPLPRVLKNFGAPAWLLGTAWLGERLVLLVDIFRAERSEAP
jgi:hypothetical protein